MSDRNPIPPKLAYEILKRDNHRCCSCGRGTDDGVTLEIDHIIPVTMGGTNAPSNLQTLCRRCNRGKSDTHPDDHSYISQQEKNKMPIPFPIIAAAVPAVIVALKAVGSVQSGGIMPNIRFKTMGGHVWRNTLDEKHGWKVQQNKFTGHCRILDPENYRIAWGGSEALHVFLEQLPLLAEAYANIEHNEE